MKILLKLKYLSLLVSLACSSFSAELRFAKIFTDRVVLQRDMSVPVWGWAEPEVEITVEFSSQKKRTTIQLEINVNKEGMVSSIRPLRATNEEAFVSLPTDLKLV